MAGQPQDVPGRREACVPSGTGEDMRPRQRSQPSQGGVCKEPLETFSGLIYMSLITETKFPIIVAATQQTFLKDIPSSLPKLRVEDSALF